MRFYSCVSPKVVRNAYTGQLVAAPCGKCNACLNTRAALWVQRLDTEAYFSPHVLFATFQYDEQNVPLHVETKRSRAYAIGEYSNNPNQRHVHKLLLLRHQT